MDKFKNKYRIPSAWLQSWDYGASGAYFITICTQNRQHFFGEIIRVKSPNLDVSKNGVLNSETISAMQLNPIGQLAEKFWLEIPNHFPCIELGNFVVMPNHIHGILIINKGDVGVTDVNATDVNVTNVTNANVETPNLGVSTGFAWQARFHDHIIRDAQSFETIQNYIAKNPSNWGKDKFHDKNV